MPLLPGLPYPLGASVRDGGVNFAVVSEGASQVELCSFDAACHERRDPLFGPDNGVWHGFWPGAGPGLRYGYRADGPYAPSRAQRFNPAKLLLDPYAREIEGQLRWDDALYGHVRGGTELVRDPRDSAAIMPKARVAAPLPGPRPSRVRIPAAETILYELHVKGFSKLNPGIPEPLRGTFAGLGHPASVEHLRQLGITSVSLLPVHFALTERRLVELGLTNYWGYNTLAWFCPDPRLSSTPDDPTATRLEFRAMVEALHAAGLEVVLDVVFNHSAEAGETGPTLSLRGLDERLYYRHDDAGRCLNWTGCGNTLDFSHPRVVQLVLDALRHWVDEYGVDGFRFDLAPTLGRADPSSGAFDPHAGLFVALAQDPTLAGIKLIAEPWDLGPGGYRLGGFPGPWLEWNDRYRDGLRRFWLRGDVDRAELARRIAGSSEVFDRDFRAPTASVNLITAHDGFTLADLVSYARKHNLANGEDDRDGHAHNCSINCGVEGTSADPEVLNLRRQLSRALLTSLLVSQGTPMLLAGDELGHSQGGNNNAYCQDNPISWIDWATVDLELLAFVQRLVALRKSHPALHQDRWLGPRSGAPGTRPVEWLRPDGVIMGADDWHVDAGTLMVRVGLGEDVLVLLINAEAEAVEFRVLNADADADAAWEVAFASVEGCRVVGGRVGVPGRAVVILTPSRPV